MKLRRRFALRLAPELEPDYWDEYDEWEDDDEPLLVKARRHKRALAQVLRFGRQKPRVAGGGAYNYTQIIDIAPALTMLEPDQSQFSTMLMKLPQQGGDAPKISWLEDELIPRSRGGYFAGSWWAGVEWEDDWELESDRRAQWERERDEAIRYFSKRSIAVAGGAGSYFRAGDLVRNVKTGEAFQVQVIRGS